MTKKETWEERFAKIFRAALQEYHNGKMDSYDFRLVIEESTSSEISKARREAGTCHLCEKVIEGGETIQVVHPHCIYIRGNQAAAKAKREVVEEVEARIGIMKVNVSDAGKLLGSVHDDLGKIISKYK